jgi:glycosyltransferase involved in cell wall biosynthesis
LADGLTQATAFPHLKILLESEKVEQVVFVTIERGKTKANNYEILKHPKLVYEPLYSKNYPINLLNKTSDFFFFPRKLKLLLLKYNIDKVIARAASAGVLICGLCKKIGIPFYVESFEPHADYMIESGTWKKWDPRAIYQKRGEEKTKQWAEGLIPVAFNYKRKLLEEGVSDDKIRVVPCSVNLDTFRFENKHREEIRSQLNIPANAYTGVYVGKFGGTYYDNEAFLLFQKLFVSEPSLRIILLSPDSKEQIISKLQSFNLPIEMFSILCVKHPEVPSYLSAADFAFSFHFPTKVSFYFSPIKNGEYWACGLPIIISENIGDDYKIVKQENIGEVLPIDWSQKPQVYFDGLIKSLKSMHNKEKIRLVAEKYRSVQNCIDAYLYFKLI